MLYVWLGFEYLSVQFYKKYSVKFEEHLRVIAFAGLFNALLNNFMNFIRPVHVKVSII